MRFLAVHVIAFLIAGFPAGMSGQELPEKQAVERYRLGGADPSEHTAFVSQPAIVAASDGSIFVLAPPTPSVTVFDGDGRYLRTIGRGGEGPGEFRAAVGHGLLADTLWVLDPILLRMATFLTDGTHLRTWRLEPIDVGMFSSTRQTITALLEGPYALAVPFTRPQGVGRVGMPVLLGDRDFTAPRPILEVIRPSGLYVEGAASFAFVPFPLPPLIAVAGNGTGFITADWSGGREDVLVLTRFTPSGEVAWVKNLPSLRPPVPGEVRDSLIAEGLRIAGPYFRRTQGEEALNMSSVRGQVSDGLPIPTHFPPASKIRLGEDGSVWIRAGDLGTNAEWTVLGADGQPRFKVHLPSTFLIQDCTLDTVWGTMTDALEIPYVVRFDIH